MVVSTTFKSTSTIFNGCTLGVRRCSSMAKVYVYKPGRELIRHADNMPFQSLIGIQAMQMCRLGIVLFVIIFSVEGSALQKDAETRIAELENLVTELIQQIQQWYNRVCECIQMFAI
ncbi:hypothetical protein DPMN_034038 [Dreissena polymorpha]|uniref:Uncharacterized protein n=1 Tax=Dreissena polymorpha TaxID=45954 RepID=A0A9D4M4Q7_DREPO|nr:hypothetical protein DPMN_034038 [Dreissena polymorpha]